MKDLDIEFDRHDLWNQHDQWMRTANAFNALAFDVKRDGPEDLTPTAKHGALIAAQISHGYLELLRTMEVLAAHTHYVTLTDKRPTK